MKNILNRKSIFGGVWAIVLIVLGLVFEKNWDKVTSWFEKDTSNLPLTVEIRTNKGSENLFFKEGEEMQIWVKANKECYLRLIYTLASKDKVLLLDNFKINKKQTGKEYRVPFRFKCSKPFGNEELKLSASQKEFKEIKFVEKYNYKFIVQSKGFSVIDENETEVSLKIKTESIK